MAKMGRPPKESNELLTARINFALLPEEKEQFEAAAKGVGMKLSAWIRKRLLSAAKRDLKQNGRTGT